MNLSHLSVIFEDMGLCNCAACLDVLSTPPTDYIDPIDTAYEMALDACWRDDYDPRSDLDIGDYL